MLEYDLPSSKDECRKFPPFESGLCFFWTALPELAVMLHAKRLLQGLSPPTYSLLLLLSSRCSLSEFAELAFLAATRSGDPPMGFHAAQSCHESIFEPFFLKQQLFFTKWKARRICSRLLCFPILAPSAAAFTTTPRLEGSP